MNIPKLVIFDMDGLLFDSETICFEILSNIAKQHNYSYTKEIYVKTVGTHGEIAKNIVMEFMPASFPYDFIMEETSKQLEEYTSTHPLPIKKGAIALLDYFKENNIPCCVCSSSHDDTIQRYLETSSLSSYFKFTIGGNNFTYTKPDPAIFLKALEIMNVDAKEALVIEDSENGILAAHRANIPVICVPDMKHPDKEFENYVTYIVSSLDQIINLF